MSVFSTFKDEAYRLGFVAAGFSKPEKPVFFDHFRSWIRLGKHGEMAWLERHQDIRESPGKLLEDCHTIISLAYPYSSKKPSSPDGYVTARYAEPQKTDYHDRLKRLGRKLSDYLALLEPGCKSRFCVDSAPILERSFAHASGMGFIGKNNMHVIPGYGSYHYLAEILTTARFAFPDMEPEENPCGSCQKCVDACPTGALERPYFLDSSRCLSYLTVEAKQPVTRDTGKRMGRCFLGCDICQEVCPFNSDKNSRNLSLPAVEAILDMGKNDFKRKWGNTALGRPGLEKLKSNIRVIRD